MDFIEFKIVDGSIVCRSVYNKKETKINSRNAARIYNILKESKYKYKTGYVKGEEVIRYYGVKQRSLNSMINNRKNITKKVNRVNKYVKTLGTGVSLIGGTLALVTLLNSIGVIDFNDMKKEEIHQIHTSIENDLSSGDVLEEEEEESEEQNFVVVDYVFDFEHKDRSSEVKAESTRDMYTDVIAKYSKMFGLPTNLMVAVATQENGVHTTKVSSDGGFGLFQIQVENGWNWVGKDITAYNFELGRYETVTVCKRADGTIDKNMLADLEYNTKIACMIMGFDVKMCGNDLVMAIQSYNSGSDVLRLKKQYGDEWINHRDELPGDSLYVENVLSYIREDDGLLEYRTVNGDTLVLGINNIYENEVHKTK